MIWERSTKGDRRALELADRHYTRQSPGSRQFCRPGRNLVLIAPSALFVWWVGFRLDGLLATECTIFRNESGRRSSDLIRAAVEAVEDWEHRRGDLVTAVDPVLTSGRRSRRAPPGVCFVHAGWLPFTHPTNRGGHGRRPLAWLRVPP